MRVSFKLLELLATVTRASDRVQGSSSKPYEITINIDLPSKVKWKRVTEICNHKIDTMENLIHGKFPKELVMLFTAAGDGLFPTPKEIHFGCSCPDSARVCKHIAAVLYGIGARLDQEPLLFFKLRDIDFQALIKKSIEEKMKSMLRKFNKHIVLNIYSFIHSLIFSDNKDKLKSI